MSTVGIALLGLGNIGAEVARTLRSRETAIEQLLGQRLEVRHVLERSPNRAARADLSPDIVTSDFSGILEDPEIAVVVEVLGQEQPAADFMRQALQAGKHVVTANKEALSKHFAYLLDAANQSERALLFEASVGGGIPIMVAYRHVLATNQVTRVRGIVNGTTNFILSQMAEAETSYRDALAEAQQLGYAEPDPTADVEGFDAVYKLAILASLMAGRHVQPAEIERTGISGVTPGDVEEARQRGGAIKLIAEAELVDGTVRARVAPEFVPGDNLLAHVRANYNAIELVGDRVGPLVLSGQGAGPLPTASAIVSDIVEALRTGKAANPASFA